MARDPLQERRQNITMNVAWTSPDDVDTKLIVTFGFAEPRGTNPKIIREVFCAGFRRDSAVVGLMNDACILLSRLLQHGERVGDLVTKVGENCDEGALTGTPASMMGAVLRAAAKLEHDLSGDVPLSTPGVKSKHLQKIVTEEETSKS